MERRSPVEKSKPVERGGDRRANVAALKDVAGEKGSCKTKEKGKPSDKAEVRRTVVGNTT
jgi:hypothetical protein